MSKFINSMLFSRKCRRMFDCKIYDSQIWSKVYITISDINSIYYIYSKLDSAYLLMKVKWRIFCSSHNLFPWRNFHSALQNSATNLLWILWRKLQTEFLYQFNILFMWYCIHYKQYNLCIYGKSFTNEYSDWNNLLFRDFWISISVIHTENGLLWIQRWRLSDYKLNARLAVQY